MLANETSSRYIPYLYYLTHIHMMGGGGGVQIDEPRTGGRRRRNTYYISHDEYFFSESICKDLQKCTAFSWIFPVRLF